jgi:hypothetical protein
MPHKRLDATQIGGVCAATQISAAAAALPHTIIWHRGLDAGKIPIGLTEYPRVSSQSEYSSLCFGTIIIITLSLYLHHWSPKSIHYLAIPPADPDLPE